VLHLKRVDKMDWMDEVDIEEVNGLALTNTDTHGRAWTGGEGKKGSGRSNCSSGSNSKEEMGSLREEVNKV
jgi:hypothetical protein